MRLQQSIFLWIAVSAILPLTLVILALTVYGERLYRQQVTQEINASLGNVITDIERNLAYERSILLRIVSSSAVQKYLPVLDVARDGEMHPDFNAKTDRLNRFLLSFNDILLGQGTFRVLDLKGNTLVKVGFGRITPASFDGFESFPFAEQEHVDISGALKVQMDEIKSSEVNFLSLLPDNRDKPMLDGVVPLIYRGERVGYLVSSLLGLQLDYILQLAPRPYQGKLSVIEVTSDTPTRHGRMLYDDSRSVFFSDGARKDHFISSALLAEIQEGAEGMVVNQDAGSTIYYAESFPYPDRLLNWVVAIEVYDGIVSRPFQRLRWGIIIFAMVMLALGILVAQFAAGKIVQPLALLVENFRAISTGKHTRSLPRQKTEELNELSQAFNEMQQNLGTAESERDQARDMMLQNAKLASIGQLAAGIGHELNNPLNNILSYASLIEREADSDSGAVHQDIEALRGEAERASKIVQGILGFSRQMPATFARFSVQGWLQQSIELVQATAMKRSVKINLHMDTDYEVIADRGLLQQAIINLLINAIQVSPKGAEVNVYATQNGGHHSVTVEDSGTGVDDETIDRLFEPFFTTKDVGEGSGLGLSITLGIVEQHHGALQLQNRYDEHDEVTGVSATMALPVVVNEEPDD
jgi:two-component system NtrC family sensor kinase